MFSGSDNINKTNVTPSPDAKLRSEDWHLFARMLSGAAYCQISISRSGPSDVRLKTSWGKWSEDLLCWDELCETVGQSVGRQWEEAGRQPGGEWRPARQWWVLGSPLVPLLSLGPGGHPHHPPPPSVNSQQEWAAQRVSQASPASLGEGWGWEWGWLVSPTILGSHDRLSAGGTTVQLYTPPPPEIH